MVVQNPSGVRATVSLRGDTVTVGRHESNDLRLPGRNVSRRHCRFDRSGAGISLEDLGSTNGVRVDGVVVSGRVHLGPGQQVQVGDYVLLFDAGNVGTEPPAPASASSLFPAGLDMQKAQAFQPDATTPGASRRTPQCALK